MSLNQSFQLPDLLGIINPLELRTNRHCRYATDASEKWLNETGLFSVDELSYLRSTKIGLLCALCFPTCDSPQLRVLTDLSTLLFYSGLRENAGGESLGLRDVDHSQPSSGLAAGSFHEMSDSESGLELLRGHVLLRQLRIPSVLLLLRLFKLASAASEIWKARFRKSVLAYQAAQKGICLNRSRNIVPSLEEYIAIAREMHGTNVVLDLAELMEVFQFPDLHGTEAEKIIVLKHTAFDVIAWSLLQQDRGSSHNLVAVLMYHNSLSVQGAMNQSGIMIKQAFSSFCSAERSILDSLDRQKSSKAPILSWVWMTLASEGVPAEAEAISETIRRYIRALKDCISAVIHWAYETELFFGKKGGEIRTFGWVFVDQVPVTH
ncbi:hypothetical protein CVT25_007752 [Psilocybe cyanescens]|uniref:Uncharacterized protein n=1 Tax=Psilocybe cyanescens TaxID=93625 RepID=A0A409XHY3_PSICY|nr:hypothetical protein CVT25_007752 [Psilocybe cyanescens]